MKHNKKVETAIATGAGLVALAAAGYFFFGPDGLKHRDQTKKKLKGWMLKLKGEVLERLEEAKEISEGAYHEIVDTVAGDYLKRGKINKAEVEKLVRELKRHWKEFAPQAGGKTVAKKKQK